MRIVAAVLFAVMLAQPALAERRLALVVGNDSYDEVTGLKKAVSDAHAMADALKPLGFEVELVDNASRSAMSRRLVDFERRLQPGDTALFYFAGHGVEIRGENYLLPTDVPNAGEGEEGLVRDTAFSARDIITRIQNRGAGRVIAILDACRNNPFEPSLGTRALGGGTNGLAGMEVPEGVFVLMSAGARQEALDTLGGDDADPNSIFTRALIESLATPGLSLVQIAKRTQTEVDRLASQVSHEQTPAYSDNINGDLVLMPAPAASPTAPATIASSASDDLAAWKTIESSRLAEDFAAYLDQFGASAIFAEAARQRIVALSSPPKTQDGADDPASTTPTRLAPTASNTDEASLAPGNIAASQTEADSVQQRADTPQIPLPQTSSDEVLLAPRGNMVATFGRAPVAVTDDARRNLRDKQAAMEAASTKLDEVTSRTARARSDLDAAEKSAATANAEANRAKAVAADNAWAVGSGDAQASNMVLSEANRKFARASHALEVARAAFYPASDAEAAARAAADSAALDLSEANELIASQINGSHRVRLWSPTGELVATISVAAVDAIAFSPEGDAIAVGQKARVQVFSTATGQQILDLAGLGIDVSSIAFSPDGKRIATASSDGVRLFGTEDGHLLQTLSGVSQSATSGQLAYDQEGTVLAYGVTHGGASVRLFSLPAGTVLRDVELGPCVSNECPVWNIRFYDGLMIASVGNEDVFVVDPNTGRTVNWFTGRLALLARNGNNPAGLFAAGDHVRIYDLLTGDMLQDVESPEIASASLSDDLTLGARRGPIGDWLIFQAQGGAATAAQ